MPSNTEIAFTLAPVAPAADRIFSTFPVNDAGATRLAAGFVACPDDTETLPATVAPPAAMFMVPVACTPGAVSPDFDTMRPLLPVRAPVVPV